MKQVIPTKIVGTMTNSYAMERIVKEYKNHITAICMSQGFTETVKFGMITK